MRDDKIREEKAKRRVEGSLKIMKNAPRMEQTFSWGRTTAVATAMTTAMLGGSLMDSRGQEGSWKANAVSPVTNPIYFEDPQIHSEVRPIFAYHNIDDDFLTQGGAAQLYAVQLRWAVTERLAIIATKDGYINFDPDAGLPKTGGFADIAGGLKYALIDNEEAEFILTPGLTFEFPTGNTRVFQGNGDGTWNPFVSLAKGFGDLRLMANVGGVIPNNFAEETAQIHYSAQVDYTTCPYFVPFVSLNFFTVLSEGTALPIDVEGFDLINFGSGDADGFTQGVLGVGFRSQLVENLFVGFAYEIPISKPRGLFGDRFTVDLIWRF